MNASLCQCTLGQFLFSPPPPKTIENETKCTDGRWWLVCLSTDCLFGVIVATNSLHSIQMPSVKCKLFWPLTAKHIVQSANWFYNWLIEPFFLKFSMFSYYSTETHTSERLVTNKLIFQIHKHLMKHFSSNKKKTTEKKTINK